MHIDHNHLAVLVGRPWIISRKLSVLGTRSCCLSDRTNTKGFGFSRVREGIWKCCDQGLEERANSGYHHRSARTGTLRALPHRVVKRTIRSDALTFDADGRHCRKQRSNAGRAIEQLRALFVTGLFACETSVLYHHQTQTSWVDSQLSQFTSSHRLRDPGIAGVLAAATS